MGRSGVSWAVARTRGTPIRVLAGGCTQTMLHMPDSDDNAIRLQGWISLYSDRKSHFRSFGTTLNPPGPTVSP